jgi:hypothetical protein
LKQLRRFLQLSATERFLLMRAALLLGTLWVGIRWIRLTTLTRWLGATYVPIQSQATREQIVWAIATAQQWLPGNGNCLPAALAAEALLRQAGHAAEIRIAVNRSNPGQLQAHAWVECDGQIVFGAANVDSDFVPLPSLRRALAS